MRLGSYSLSPYVFSISMAPCCVVISWATTMSIKTSALPPGNSSTTCASQTLSNSERFTCNSSYTGSDGDEIGVGHDGPGLGDVGDGRNESGHTARVEVDPDFVGARDDRVSPGVSADGEAGARANGTRLENFVGTAILE